MSILVLNAGSTSLKLDLYDALDAPSIARARVERVGTPECRVRVGDGEPEGLGEADHAEALAQVLPRVLGERSVRAVGHRVVHGGEQFSAPTKVDDDVLAAIDALATLAPLHNPPAAAALRAAMARLPGATHVAVFDTAFHATLPARAKHYALPAALAEKHGIRRYGFHGTSHEWVARAAARHLGEDLRDLRVITCHLGGGCSIAAVENGRSVETSMGLTPLEGLVMATRVGDVDAGALLHLARAEELDLDGLDRVLQRESGLAGLSGLGSDMRDIEAKAAEGHEGARRAIQVFAHRARKYVGAYAAVMGGVDAIVFTAGIGQNSALARHRIAQRLDFLGARLDEDLNRAARVSVDTPVVAISDEHARCKILVVRTDEARAIAEAAESVHLEAQRVNAPQVIPIAVSARHVHLDRRAVAALFGEGHELTPYKPLSQPGQFACEEKVDLIGPKRTIEGVRVLGPVRGRCQIEVSRTDEFQLGVDAPVRDSGKVQGTPGITLRGPKGELHLEEGLICARRHIHMTPEDAEAFGVEDKDVVEVAVDSAGRDLIFGDVLVRVSSKYALEMHLDTDEANAAEIVRGHEGALVLGDKNARLIRKTARGEQSR